MIISISWWPTQETNGKRKQANALSEHISYKTRGWGGGMKRCVFWRKLSKLLSPYLRLRVSKTKKPITLHLRHFYLRLKLLQFNFLIFHLFGLITVIYRFLSFTSLERYLQLLEFILHSRLLFKHHIPFQVKRHPFPFEIVVGSKLVC